MAKPKEKKKPVKTDSLRATPSLKNSRTAIFIILIITFFIFYPSVHYQFVNWDDDVNIIQNQNVQHLTHGSLKNIFTGTVIGGYTPLTTLTFAMEKHFFGLNPGPFHLDNILLHLINTLLVFILLKRLGMSFFVTCAVSLLFGIHPMRTESVAWVTERKDVLYTLFYLLSAISYIRFRYTRKTGFYILSLAMFILSLLSKIQAVSLPLTLILVDYYLERRFYVKQIYDKIPFLAFSLLTGLAGVYFLRQAGSLETGTILPFVQRFFIGSYSLMVYVIKGVIPYEMSAIYPFPARLSFIHYLSLPLVLLAGFLIWKNQKFRTEVIFGFLFFFFNVIFMLQVVGAGQGYIADRFTYIPYIGLFFILAFLAEKLAAGNQKGIILASGVIYLMILGFMTHNRLKVWQNSETLFSDVIAKYPKVAVAYNNMGRYFREQKQYDKAIASYNKALEINPKGYSTWSNRGKAYFDTGRLNEAISDFNKSIEINGEYAEARSNRGAALAAKGDFQKALPDLDKAIQLDPANINAFSNRSLTYYSMNQFAKAVDDINSYLRLKPEDADMLNLRALCFSQMNQNREALADFDEAIKLQPSQGIFWQNRSFLYKKTGNKAAALSDILRAQELGIKVNPEYLKALK